MHSRHSLRNRGGGPPAVLLLIPVFACACVYALARHVQHDRHHSDSKLFSKSDLFQSTIECPCRPTEARTPEKQKIISRSVATLHLPNAVPAALVSQHLAIHIPDSYLNRLGIQPLVASHPQLTRQVGCGRLICSPCHRDHSGG